MLKRKDSKLNFPKLSDAIECIKLSKLTCFHGKEPSVHSPSFRTGGTSKLTVHFATRNTYDTSVFIATSKKHKYVVVALGGSEHIRDWQSIFSFRKTKYGPEGFGDEQTYKWTCSRNAKVHYGFNIAFFADHLHMRIAHALDAVKTTYSSYRTLVCGQNLGAALAILAGTFLAKERPKDNINVFAFGSSRVGNDAFRTWVDGLQNCSLWRFVYDGDLVCRLPPSAAGFHHVGHLLQIEGGGPVRAYYRQKGDKRKGLSGPPPEEWEARAFRDMFRATNNRAKDLYKAYLESQWMKVHCNPNALVVESFERISSGESSERGGNQSQSIVPSVHSFELALLDDYSQFHVTLNSSIVLVRKISIHSSSTTLIVTTGLGSTEVIEIVTSDH